MCNASGQIGLSITQHDSAVARRSRLNKVESRLLDLLEEVLIVTDDHKSLFSGYHINVGIGRSRKEEIMNVVHWVPTRFEDLSHSIVHVCVH